MKNFDEQKFKFEVGDVVSYDGAIGFIKSRYWGEDKLLEVSFKDQNNNEICLSFEQDGRSFKWTPETSLKFVSRKEKEFSITEKQLREALRVAIKNPAICSYDAIVRHTLINLGIKND